MSDTCLHCEQPIEQWAWSGGTWWEHPGSFRRGCNTGATYAEPTPEGGEVSDNYCWSLGPRIGDEGKPVCFRESGHSGSHRSHPDSGFDEQWGAPDMIVPEGSRDEYWTPTEALNV